MNDETHVSKLGGYFVPPCLGGIEGVFAPRAVHAAVRGCSGLDERPSPNGLIVVCPCLSFVATFVSLFKRSSLHPCFTSTPPCQCHSARNLNPSRLVRRSAAKQYVLVGTSKAPRLCSSSTWSPWFVSLPHHARRIRPGRLHPRTRRRPRRGISLPRPDLPLCPCEACPTSPVKTGQRPWKPTGLHCKDQRGCKSSHVHLTAFTYLPVYIRKSASSSSMARRPAQPRNTPFVWPKRRSRSLASRPSSAIQKSTTSRTWIRFHKIPASSSSWLHTERVNPRTMPFSSCQT